MRKSCNSPMVLLAWREMAERGSIWICCIFLQVSTRLNKTKWKGEEKGWERHRISLQRSEFLPELTLVLEGKELPRMGVSQTVIFTKIYTFIFRQRHGLRSSNTHFPLPYYPVCRLSRGNESCICLLFSCKRDAGVAGQAGAPSANTATWG